ncbi:hypothetical protein [Mariniphaga sediminis]|uniref:hypothetical protein n=1 Tax=Mariniphaga sediminis TaxID=1628158 RepID=UPI0035661D04
MKTIYTQMKEIVSLLLILLLLSSCNEKKENTPITTIEEYRELRAEKLNQPRPVIFNNDGGDALMYPVDERYSKEYFLDKRSSGLLETDVSSIAYCTTSSGFGHFTRKTKAGEMLLESPFHSGIRKQYRNITGEMIAEGTDPLQATVDFSRENNYEIFWSNRMNDTHDESHRKDWSYFLWTDFKDKNPHYLWGKMSERTPHGRWSAVDYAQQEVRDKCVSFYREACENYDIDGVELDFLRHFQIFKSVGWGNNASQEEQDMLTDMVRQIREVTEEVGMKKGKPILVIVRVPTSPEFSKNAGADYKRWIEEGLVDIVAGSCYFRMDFWENFLKLGEGRDVKIYAGLSESRVKNFHPLLKRQQNAVFRARAAAAWAAGVDGVYSFNQYNTRVKYLSQIGAPEKLKNTNNLYFVTYRDYGAERYLKGGDNYFKMPRLSPSLKELVKFNAAPFSYDIEIGDESTPAEVYAAIYAEQVKAENIIVKINGTTARYKQSAEDNLFIFELDQSAVKEGMNKLDIAYDGKPGEEAILKDAAIFFCRDKEDVELRDLIAACK